MTNRKHAVTDTQFLELFDLGRADLSAAREAVSRGQPAAAVDEVLAAIERRPLRGFTTIAEAAELGRLLARDMPWLVERLRELAARAQQPARRPGVPASADALAQWQSFWGEVNVWTRRARGVLTLGQLVVLTGETHWAEAAAELVTGCPRYPDPVKPDDSFLPLYQWHPGHNPACDALGMAHAVQYLVAAMPMLWPAWDRQARMDAIAFMAHWADVLHRGSRDDQPFNIPLHGLVAALGAAALFSQLRAAPRWVATMTGHLTGSGAYVSAPFAGGEGYFHEGFGYQNVNQMLLMQSLLLLERSLGVPPEPLARLRSLVHASYEFAAATVRPDGATFLVCDCMSRAYHEHEMDMHEGLHLGAALFDDPALKARAGSPTSPRLDNHLPFFMGLECYRRWRAMPEPDIDRRPHQSAAFSESGFLHLRSGSGPSASHAMLKASVEHNHAHFDCLSANFYALGRELIGDSGSGPYGDGLSEPPRGQRAHAVCRLTHLAPPGPRLQGHAPVPLKRFVASPSGRIQIALADHELIANHRQRRAIMLLQPGPAGELPFWIVWDEVSHAGSPLGGEPQPAGRPAPMRFIETLFPLHAPGGRARLGQAASGELCRTAWSLHHPDDRLASSHGEKLPITCRQASAAMEHGDSDANIQVTALRPADQRTALAVVLEEGFSSHFGFACRRPVLSFRWRGRLPHECAYVLLPFAGVSQEQPFEVSGWCQDRGQRGAFEAEIAACPDGRSGQAGRACCRLSVQGLAGMTGEPISISLSPGQEVQDELSFIL